MKFSPVLMVALLILSGCAPAAQDAQAGSAQLTPWLTATANAPAPTAAPEKPAATSAPAPTPTPTIHIVALGESISTIALRYGLDTAAVLAANPDIDPNAMTVGMQVAIPAGSPQVQIGVISEPLALTVGQPDCSRTPDGGLWCFAALSNPLDEAAALMAVTFTLTGSDPDTSKTITVPALLDYLPAAETLPAAAFFSAPIPDDYQVTASLAAAFAASQSGKTFFSVDTGKPLVKMQDRMASASGEAMVAAETGTTVDVQIAALAYDMQGNLMGVRQTESRVTLEEGQGVVFNLKVYSTGAAIASVVVKAQALLAGK